MTGLLSLRPQYVSVVVGHGSEINPGAVAEWHGADDERGSERRTVTDFEL
jgi:hypothetical protein